MKCNIALFCFLLVGLQVEAASSDKITPLLSPTDITSETGEILFRYDANSLKILTIGTVVQLPEIGGQITSATVYKKTVYPNGDISLFMRDSDSNAEGAVITVGKAALHGTLFGSQTTLHIKGQDEVAYLSESQTYNYNDDVITVDSVQDEKFATYASVQADDPIFTQRDYVNDDYRTQNTIDVLALYDNGVQDEYTEVATAIQHFFAEANYSLERSKVFLKLNPVFIQHMDIDGTANCVSEDLIRRLTSEQPYRGQIVESRMENGADLAHFFLSCASSSTVGLASPSPNNPDYFTTISITDAKTLLHEIGHMLGLAHGRGGALTDNIYGRGYGYGVDYKFATLMNSDPGNVRANGIFQFSNPRLNCMGEPCGVFYFDDASNAVDATYVLNHTKSVVADYASPPPVQDDISVALSNVSDPTLRECIADRPEQYVHELRDLLCSGTFNSLAGLSQFTHLESLDLSQDISSSVADVSEIAGLTRLTRLRLTRIPIADSVIFAPLTRLRGLSVNDNSLSSIVGLSNAENLEAIGISNNLLSDLSPLAALASKNELEELYLSDNIIKNIRTVIELVESLTRLERLILTGNAVYCWQHQLLKNALTEKPRVNYVNTTECDATNDSGDEDNDGVTNLAEVQNGTNPFYNESYSGDIEVPEQALYFSENQPAIINVVRKNGTYGSPTVTLSVLQTSTAQQDSDFILNQTEFAFAEGSETLQIPINLVADDEVETTEQIDLNLSFMVDNQMVTEFYSLFVEDNHPQYNAEASFLPFPTIKIVNENDGVVELPVQKLGNLSSPLTVQIAPWDAVMLTDNGPSSDYPTEEGVDYIIQQPSLTFAADNVDEIKSFKVEILDDDLVENIKYIAFNVSENEQRNQIMFVKIEDNDYPATGSFTWQKRQYNSVEGQGSSDGPIIITRLGSSDGEANLTISATSDDPLIDLGDLEFETQIRFAAGQTTYPLNFYYRDNNYYQPPNLIQLIISPDDDESVIPQQEAAWVRIDDNDAVPSGGYLQFTQNSLQAGEEDSSVILNVSRETTSDQPLAEASVNVEVSGSASNGTDYNYPPQVLNFSAGESSKSIEIILIDDQEIEDSETIELQLSNPQNAILFVPSKTRSSIEIIDNDEVTETFYEFSQAFYDINESVSTLDVEINRSGDISNPSYIQVNVSAINANVGEDFNFQNTQLMFEANETSKSVTVDIIDDLNHEEYEEFNLSLQLVEGGELLEPSSTIISITDNDPMSAIGWDATSATVPETSGTYTLNVVRMNQTRDEVTFSAIVDSSSTAAIDNDYTLGATEFTLSSEHSAIPIEMTIVDDSVTEDTETIVLLLTSSDAEVPTAMVTVSITDNDTTSTPPPSGGGSSSNSGGGGSLPLSTIALLFLLNFYRWRRRLLIARN